jgi:microcystin-dependent protein
MSVRKVTYFKADALADLANVETDNIVFVTETGKSYHHNGSAWIVEEGGQSSEAFPVGSVYVSVGATNPGATLGYGTWTAFGSGRTLVGFDGNQTEFDTAEKTGGAKTHTLLTSEMPAHTHVQDSHNHTQNAHTHIQDAHSHTQSVNSAVTGALSGYTPDTSTNTSVTSGYSTGAATAVNQNATATNNAATATNQSTGGGGAHNNLQPYIVVYFWRRSG